MSKVLTDFNNMIKTNIILLDNFKHILKDIIDLKKVNTLESF